MSKRRQSHSQIRTTCTFIRRSLSRRSAFNSVPKGFAGIASVFTLSLALCASGMASKAIAQQAVSTEIQPASQAANNPVLERAAELLGRGELGNAEKIYSQYTKVNPMAWHGYYGLAEVAIRRHDFRKGEQYLKKALTLQPESTEILARTGWMYHQWSQSKIAGNNGIDFKAAASEYLEQARRLTPDDPQTLTYMGEVALDTGDRVTAEQLFTQVLQANPTSVPALLGLARYHIVTKDDTKAKEALFQAFEIEPDNQRASFLMAQLLAQAEHPDKAITYALRSKEADGGNTPSRDLFLAQQYEKLGDWERALKYYQNVYEQAPDYAPGLLKMAEIANASGNEELAHSYYKQAMQADPSLYPGMKARAQTAMRMEQIPDALSQWRRVLRFQSNDTDALHAIASIYYLQYFHNQVNQGELLQDMQLFDQAAIDPNAPDAAWLTLDRIKLGIARQGQVGSMETQALKELSASNDDFIAGQALFLLKTYAESKSRLDFVDGVTAEGYLKIADHLLMLQSLDMASTMYQRGFQLAQLPEIQQGLKRVEAKKILADKRLKEGDDFYVLKQYDKAIAKYEDAIHIYPDWHTPYMRMGDTYEKMRRPADAYVAYRTVVSLSPGLLESSVNFTKQYRKLERAYLKQSGTEGR